MSESFLLATATRRSDAWASVARGDSLVQIFEKHVEVLGARRLYTWRSADLSESASLSYADCRRQATSICCAIRLRWRLDEGARVVLVHPPGLDLIVAFLGCQYAACIAVPFYPPRLPTSPMPSDTALRQFSDGLDRLRRVCASAEPALLLTTRAYLRLSYASTLVTAARGAQYAWPAGWTWQASDDIAAPSEDELSWLDKWIPTRVGADVAEEVLRCVEALEHPPLSARTGISMHGCPPALTHAPARGCVTEPARAYGRWPSCSTRVARRARQRASW